jgi:hypothetical protein
MPARSFGMAQDPNVKDRNVKDRNEGIVISAEKARQGQIILRKPWQRAVFIAGLIGIVVLAVLMRIFAWH